MGFGSLVSKGLSAASKVKSAVKSVKKGLKAIKSVADLTGLTYRNSLLYDFSSVVRARIYVFEYNSVKKDVAERFRLIDNLPVQINPDEYYRRKSNGYVMNLGEAKKTGEVPSGDSMDFILKFNIVDEYKLMTRDGLYPIPLNLDEVTIISKLNSLSNLVVIISLCKSPKNPVWKPNPKASLVSGSKVKLASFNCNFSKASLKSSYLLVSVG